MRLRFRHLAGTLVLLAPFAFSPPLTTAQETSVLSDSTDLTYDGTTSDIVGSEYDTSTVASAPTGDCQSGGCAAEGCNGCQSGSCQGGDCGLGSCPGCGGVCDGSTDGFGAHVVGGFCRQCIHRLHEKLQRKLHSAGNSCSAIGPMTEDSVPDLFYNFYVPNTRGAAAAAYPCPYPTPSLVGHTYYTYQPLMPHEYLYHHKRSYYQFYDGGMGLNRTRVSWHGTPLRTGLKSIGKAISLPY